MKEFKADELIKFVSETEQKVADLYQKMSENTKGKSQRVFENLSKDELKHKEMYENMAENLKGVFKISEEDYNVLNQLMKKDSFKGFNAKENFVKEDALVLAEKVEKDGIILYSEILRIFDDIDKDLVENIIEEERKHLRLVLNKQFNANLPNLML
ncbi:MAG: ferritin family protein [Bacillota bacterium]